MAIAFVQEVTGDPGDRSTDVYDMVREKLNVDADPPVGMVVHTAGFTDTGVFRIFDVWETRHDWERFRDERLMPVLDSVMGDAEGPPPSMVEYTYELHDVVRG